MGHVRDRWKDTARKGKGRRWQVKYQVDGREKDGGSFDTRAIAQRRLVELESSVQRGQWVDTTDKTTVAQACTAYAATRPYGPSTTERVDGTSATTSRGPRSAVSGSCRFGRPTCRRG